MKIPMSRLRTPSLLTTLALLAALLLAVVPTLGRLYQSAQSESPPAIALCTLEGLDVAAQPLWALAGDAGDHEDRAAGKQSHPDCDYCPLLAGLAVPTLLVLGLPAPAPTAPTPFWRPARHLARRHPSGLGSRGPPLRF